MLILENPADQRKVDGVIEALEALAPKDFSKNKGFDNLLNCISTLIKNFEGAKALWVSSWNVFIPESVLVLKQIKQKNVHNEGFCSLLWDVLVISGLTEINCNLIVEELKCWWEKNYAHYSGITPYPIEHPFIQSPSVAYGDESVSNNLWLTAEDLATAPNNNFYEANSVYQHVIYCERRYQLVQCTVDYFRHLLALKDTQR